MGETELKGYYRVYAPEKNIKNASVSVKSMDYDMGNEIIPVNKSDFELIMPGESEPLDSEYFEVVSITRNRFIGTATVTVRGRNGYGGIRKIRIRIMKRNMAG